MKRKILVVSAVSIIVTAVIANYDYVKAENPKVIRSQGNLVLEDGSSMAVYSSDIHYLQEEIDYLFRELPNYSNERNDSILEED